eukprot:10711081-Alexandrium_andersonii.AAC.1
MRVVAAGWRPTWTSLVSTTHPRCRRLGPLGRRLTCVYGLSIIGWRTGRTDRPSGLASVASATAPLEPRRWEWLWLGS